MQANVCDFDAYATPVFVPAIRPSCASQSSIGLQKSLTFESRRSGNGVLDMTAPSGLPTAPASTDAFGPISPSNHHRPFGPAQCRQAVSHSGDVPSDPKPRRGRSYSSTPAVSMNFEAPDPPVHAHPIRRNPATRWRHPPSKHVLLDPEVRHDLAADFLDGR